MPAQGDQPDTSNLIRSPGSKPLPTLPRLGSRPGRGSPFPVKSSQSTKTRRVFTETPKCRMVKVGGGCSAYPKGPEGAARLGLQEYRPASVRRSLRAVNLGGFGWRGLRQERPHPVALGPERAAALGLLEEVVVLTYRPQKA